MSLTPKSVKSSPLTSDAFESDAKGEAEGLCATQVALKLIDGNSCYALPGEEW